MNIQIKAGNDWFYLEAISGDFFRTTADVSEALSADYLDIVQAKYPNMKFRGI